MLHADYTHAYNHHRPHSVLGYLTPAAFAAAWKSRMSIASNKAPCNGLQGPERDRPSIQPEFDSDPAEEAHDGELGLN